MSRLTGHLLPLFFAFCKKRICLNLPPGGRLAERGETPLPRGGWQSGGARAEGGLAAVWRGSHISRNSQNVHK